VDEVDSILIDERGRRSSSQAPPKDDRQIRARAPHHSAIGDGEEVEWSDTLRQERWHPLGEGEKYMSGDYFVDEKQRTIGVTDSGWETIEKALGIGNIADAENWELKHYVETAIKAHALYKRDVTTW